MLARPKVREYITGHFIPVKVDFDREQVLARQFGVQGIPDLWFLDSQGEKLRRVNGFVEEDTLLPMLEYIAEDAFRQMTFKAFLKRE